MKRHNKRSYKGYLPKAKLLLNLKEIEVVRLLLYFKGNEGNVVTRYRVNKTSKAKK